MPDMLVKLYELSEPAPLPASLTERAVDIRRALAPELHLVVGWVRAHFGEHWASECHVSFTSRPLGCFIATQSEQLIGFACYEATCRNYFGPTGVATACRGWGVGRALLLACLQAMRAEGYAYAIIGGAGPVDFYAKACSAVPIAGSQPGIYRGMLRGPTA